MRSADEWARRFADGGRIAERVAVVVAHADDETLFAGPLLGRLDDGLLIHVTDGAPVDMTDARRLGLATREDYAAVRARELDRAVAALDAVVERQAYGIADQGATAAMAAIAERLADDLDGAAVVATHAYEGGHPDHDTMAFAVAAAVARIARRGGMTPVQVEFASYHLLDGERVWARFWPDPAYPERTRPFAAGDTDRVEAALAAHASQASVFDDWRPSVERWRAAPTYDFTRPPPPGEYLYDRFGWAVTGERWRAAARAY
jgi:LmbE family N-acetylglucosaminyl deacetylase